ncbi:MAG TPA: acetolactate synthase large subunit [Acidimicrobiales bacterium]|nr:acetolactate synthase large subunit [Acidimicrobiales bacterium]
MNGAHALLATLEANDVNVCFANPGTSEMHFVAALDDAPAMRGILCLFEGVATGAADGYARVKGSPAATLLHLGPGLANGWANLHNARRARVPLLNIVGDHATYHAHLDAPLQSNVRSLADALEGWYCRTTSAGDVAGDGARAVEASYGPPGRVATLVLPADVSWSDAGNAPPSWPRARRPAPLAIDEATFDRALAALRSKRCTILLGGGALSTEHTALARRLSSATTSRLMMETFPAMMGRGAGVASPERLIYLSEFAIDQLKDSEVIVLIGSKEPVGFFAYPDVPGRLAPEGCELIDLAPPGSDTLGVLEALVEALRAPVVPLERGEVTPAPSGELTTHSFSAAVGATLKEGVIVADESITSGAHLFSATRFAPEHQWMTLTGGAIGYGLPVALGAAVASKGRVLALESDGAMMYTLQALWTMAREGLDVTVVGLSNRSYAVLNMELTRVGAVTDGAASTRLLELDDPTLDLSQLARAQGVPSVRVTSADELVVALERSYATPGPAFIEAVLPKGLH